ncbi:hypothetical protein GCM10011585_33170 [Edaphobacter dinghuensis]|uniref:Uncharacterized protein n=1 Tax=Edaphobacter dinghuensis TaxID=1560005 RepID=A0A917HPI0_9BACT|nr:hypothetical protein GCM10011585_33170 [Edaphobacter dinghuensis]
MKPGNRFIDPAKTGERCLVMPRRVKQRLHPRSLHLRNQRGIEIPEAQSPEELPFIWQKKFCERACHMRSICLNRIQNQDVETPFVSDECLYVFCQPRATGDRYLGKCKPCS